MLDTALHLIADRLRGDDFQIGVGHQDTVQFIVRPDGQTYIPRAVLDPHLLAGMYRLGIHAIPVVLGLHIIEIRLQNHLHRLLIVP